MTHDSAGSLTLPREASDSDAALKLDEFLPYRLNVASNAVSQALSHVYADRYAIGVPEWRVLITLAQFGTMTGKAIGSRSHMHKTKVSRAVAELEQLGLVARRANEADLREAFLSLTPAGRAAYEEVAPAAVAFGNRLRELVAPEDRLAFDRALTALIEHAPRLLAEAARKG